MAATGRPTSQVENLDTLLHLERGAVSVARDAFEVVVALGPAIALDPTHQVSKCNDDISVRHGTINPLVHEHGHLKEDRRSLAQGMICRVSSSAPHANIC